MKLKTRRTIYITLILIFVIATPIIILYFSGYRYNIKKNKISRIGAIELQSSTLPQDGATVYLNGELYSKKLTDKLWIDDIFPDEYNVKIEKENYFSCEKKVQVNSNLTTFIKGVNLFKKSVSQYVGNYLNYYYSPDNKTILLLINDGQNYRIDSLDANENKIQSLIPFLSQKPTKIQWSADNTIIALSFDTTKDNYIFDLNAKTGYFLSEINDSIFENIYWGENSHELYGIKQNSLYDINLIDRTSNKILNFPANLSLKNIFIIGSKLYLITNDKTYSYINTVDAIKPQCNTKILNSCQAMPSLIASFRKTDNFNLQKNGNDIIFYDAQNKIVYIIDESQTINTIKEKISDVNGLKLQNGKLLYWNEFEIWTYENNNKNLIERTSSSITQANWYSDQNYILYSTNYKLILNEIRQQETCNNYELTQINGLKDIFVSQKGNSLYFLGKTNENEGLYYYSLL